MGLLWDEFAGGRLADNLGRKERSAVKQDVRQLTGRPSIAFKCRRPLVVSPDRGSVCLSPTDFVRIIKFRAEAATDN